MQQENRNLEGQEQDRIGTGEQQGTQQPTTNPGQQQQNENRPDEGQGKTGEGNTQKEQQENTDSTNQQRGL